MTSPPTTTSEKPLLILVNPVCGSRNASKLYEEHLVPYLNAQLPHAILRSETTTHANHAGELIIKFIQSVSHNLPAPEAKQGAREDTYSRSEGGVDADVILLSGDGTLHEIINVLSTNVNSPLRTIHGGIRVNIALVPCGTANAMYQTLFSKQNAQIGVQDGTAEQNHAWMLRSVDALLHSLASGGSSSKKKNIDPLRFSITTFSATSSAESAPPVASSTALASISSAVVVSTSLHAVILHRSEDLRHSTPGIERFKIAAMENIARWYKAKVVLHGSGLQRYDSKTQSFTPASNGSDELVLEGPFAYFLSTTTCDRLEEQFVITPLQSQIPPSPEGTRNFMDVIVVRPLRDPALSHLPNGSEAKEKFAERLGAVLMAAYQKGDHVNMKYEDGQEVVEYFRCSGWEWFPVSTDDHAHLVCTDGAISRIPAGGKVACVAALGSTPSDSGEYTHEDPVVEFQLYH